MNAKPLVRKCRASAWWYIQLGPGPYRMSDYYLTQYDAFMDATRLFGKEKL